jgi:hypothetical protein
MMFLLGSLGLIDYYFVTLSINHYMMCLLLNFLGAYFVLCSLLLELDKRWLYLMSRMHAFLQKMLEGTRSGAIKHRALAFHLASEGTCPLGTKTASTKKWTPRHLQAANADKGVRIGDQHRESVLSFRGRATTDEQDSPATKLHCPPLRAFELYSLANDLTPSDLSLSSCCVSGFMIEAVVSSFLGSIVRVTWSWDWLGHVELGNKDGLKWQMDHYCVCLSFVHFLFLFYFQQLSIWRIF